MKPGAPTPSTSKDTGEEQNGTKKTPRFRSVIRQLSEDKAGQVKTTTFLERITDSENSDRDIEIQDQEAKTTSC